MYNNKLVELENGIIPENDIGATICKLCGAISTDGTIYKQNKIWNNYPISSYYFEITDEWYENILLVSEWIFKLINKKGSIKPYKGAYRFRIGNKALVKYLVSLGIPYGQKCETISIPNKIFMMDNDFLLAFITSAIMFDGTVKLDGTIEFSTISKKLRDQIVKILKMNNVKVKKFKQKFERWSDKWKYGFYSKSFDFFLDILEGPKKEKLNLIRRGKEMNLKELLNLFPERAQSKGPILKEIYNQILHNDGISFKKLKRNIEKILKIKVHRNTILLYLNLLVKSKIMIRTKRGCYKIVK